MFDFNCKPLSLENIMRSVVLILSFEFLGSCLKSTFSCKEGLKIFYITKSDPVCLYFQLLKETNIRCSMIGLAAEVRICKKLCTDTNGMILSFKCIYLHLTAWKIVIYLIDYL